MGVVITDLDGTVGTDGAVVPSKVIQVGGTDGTNLQTIKTNSDGTVVVDGSGHTQPVSGTVAISGTPTISGTVTANAGSNLNTSALALDSTLTGGTQKVITRGGAKGSTIAADLTSTAEGTDHQALDIQIYHGGTAINPTSIRALTSSDVVDISDKSTRVVGRVFLRAPDDSVNIGSSINPVRIDPTGSTTQPVAVASLPLPTGASTSAKQPALGIAGTASTDVLSVQGIASMTPLKTDSSATTQPISGTITANVGTTNGLALDATLTGGTSKSIVRGGQKGATITNADITHTAEGADHEALDVQLYHGGVAKDPTQVRALTSADVVTANAGTGTFAVSAATLPLPTGASISAKQPALGTAGNASTDVISVQGIASMTALKVDGSAVTQPVSASSLPLPTGAATAAKQPSLGVAGTASADVISVQGIASMTALKTDGSAVTQPVSGTVAVSTVDGTVAVSGTVTANAGTNLNTSALVLDATVAAQSLVDNAGFTDGTTRVLPSGFIYDEVAGTALTENDVAAARIDSKRAVVFTMEDATTRSQRAAVSAAGAVKVDGSAVTQPVSNASLPLPAGASTSAKQPVLGVAGTASTDVLSVQGIASMTALKVDGSAVTQPISGTVTTSSPATGTIGAAVPSSAVTFGASDSTNLQVVRVFDADTGGGTQYVLGAILRKGASGGSVEAGTSSDPLRTDPTGSTTQPVSGTVTANIGTSGSLALDASVTGLQLVDNAGFTDGTTRVVPLGFIYDEVAGTALTENDVGSARMDSKRAVVVSIEDVTTRGRRMQLTAASTPAAKADIGVIVTQSPNKYAGTVTNATETSVSSSAVSVASADSTRVRLFVQNTGFANVTLGMTGVTATTGIQMTPGTLITLEPEDGCQAQWYAIREGSQDSKVRTMPVT